MQEQEQPTTETVTLHSGGAVPGIPGEHGPGTYLINWLERTITPVVRAIEAEIAQAIHPSAENVQVETSSEPVSTPPAETVSDEVTPVEVPPTSESVS